MTPPSPSEQEDFVARCRTLLQARKQELAAQRQDLAAQEEALDKKRAALDAAHDLNLHRETMRKARNHLQHVQARVDRWERLIAQEATFLTQKAALEGRALDPLGQLRLSNLKGLLQEIAHKKTRLPQRQKEAAEAGARLKTLEEELESRTKAYAVQAEPLAVAQTKLILQRMELTKSVTDVRQAERCLRSSPSCQGKGL